MRRRRVERLQEPGVERPVEVRGERSRRGVGRRQAGVQAQGEDDGLGRGGIADRPRPSRRAGAPAAHRPRAPAPAGTRPAAPRSSAATTPSNAWAPGPTASYGRALPVGEVVPALVAGPGPVRDLVAAEARRRPAARRRARTAPRPGRRPGRGPPPRASAGRPDVVGRWSPERPGDALGIGVVERQRVGRDVVDAERRSPRRASPPRRRPTAPARRTAGRPTPTRSRRPAPRRPRRRRRAGRWRRPEPPQQRRDRTTARRARAGSRPPRPAPPRRRARPARGSPRS